MADRESALSCQLNGTVPPTRSVAQMPLKRHPETHKSVGAWYFLHGVVMQKLIVGKPHSDRRTAASHTVRRAEFLFHDINYFF